MRPRLPLPSALLIGALLCATVPVAADWNAREVLGDRGEVYAVRSVPLESEALSTGGSMLELEIRSPDQAAARHVVPGTEGKDPDLNPYLIFDDASSTLYTVWETRVSGIFSQIRLAWFQEGAWSEPVHVHSNPYAVRSEAHLAVTRDQFSEDVDGELVEHHRTLIHIAWWEDSEGGQVVYAPLTVMDGVLAEESRNYSLQRITEDELLQAVGPGLCGGSSTPGTELRGELALSSVERGPREAVLVTFVDEVSGCLHTVQIAPVPADLVSLGDKLRGHMIEIGNRSRPTDVESLADKLRGHMIEIGNRLEPPVRNALARAVHDRVLEVGPDYDLDPEGLVSLGDDLRGHMIEIGRQLESISVVRPKSKVPANTVEVGGPWSEGSNEVRHLLELRLLATRRIPEGVGEKPRFLLSPDAGRAVIAWDAGGAVRYRESLQDGWSPVRALGYEDPEERDQVFELLYDRVQR